MTLASVRFDCEYKFDYEYDFLETFRFDYEYEFDYEYDFLETFRFDYEYEFDYKYNFLEIFMLMTCSCMSLLRQSLQRIFRELNLELSYAPERSTIGCYTMD